MIRSIVFTLVSSVFLPGFFLAAEPKIVAHRGLLKHAPENTLANFRATLELRLGFEFDVQKTKDGELVCIHDDDVKRTTNGTGLVADLTLAQIRKLDAGRWFDPRFAGERVPTVEEVLALIAKYRTHDLLIAVDLKSADVESEVVRLAEKHKVLNKLIFIGRTIDHPDVRKQLKKASSAASVAVVANTPKEFDAALADASADWVYFRYIPSKLEVEKVHAKKKRAFIAGVTVSGRNAANWRAAGAAGIDGLLTDYPLDLAAMQRGKKD